MNVVFLFCGKAGEVGMIREYIIKISDEIMEEEIADRPQVLVRCKNCRYYNSEPDSQGDHCDKIHWSRGTDWFCADGRNKRGGI